jgi:SOS-response transcriptional repressor LexA
VLGMAAATRNRPAIPPKSAGAAIRDRRAYLGLSAEDVAHLTGGVINLRLLTRLENDHLAPQSLRIGKYKALLTVLQLTPAEFEEVTGVPPMTSEPVDLPGSRPYSPTLRVPIAGEVSAGLQAVQMLSDFAEHILLDPSLPGLRNRREADLVALRVTGESMVSEKAGMSIRPGSHVVVELGAIPENGDIVAAWLTNHEIAVLKQYREGPESILRSLNSAGPAFRLGTEPFEVRGVVRAVISYP